MIKKIQLHFLMNLSQNFAQARDLFPSMPQELLFLPVK